MMVSNLQTTPRLRVLAEAPVARELQLICATDATRLETLNGQEHLVLPVVALMEGIIQPANAPEPEFVPADVIARSVQGWNGRPCVGGHPMVNNQFVSANDPTILQRESFGSLFNSQFKNNQLHLESWINVAAAEKHEIGASVLRRAREKKPIEVSTGVFVTHLQDPGQHKGRSYQRRWATAMPDHLAFLREGERGACSNAMGCGIRASTAHRITEQGIEIVEPELTEVGVRGLLDRLTSLFKNERSVIVINAASAAEPAVRGNCGCQGAGMKDKAQRIQALIDSKKFTDADKKWLEAVPDDRLEALETAVKVESPTSPTPPTPPPTPSTPPATPPATPPTPPPTPSPEATALAAAKTAEQFINLAPTDLQEPLREALRTNQEKREGIITALKATGRCELSDEELKGATTPYLEKLLKLAQAPEPTVFFGRPASAAGDDKKQVSAPPDLIGRLRAAKAK